MNWNLALQIWGPFSAIAVVVGWLYVWGLEFRDDYRELRRIVCSESSWNIALSLSILEESEKGIDPNAIGGVAARIATDAMRGDLRHAQVRRDNFCLQ